MVHNSPKFDEARSSKSWFVILIVGDPRALGGHGLLPGGGGKEDGALPQQSGQAKYFIVSRQ